jgi:hypothetical protein
MKKCIHPDCNNTHDFKIFNECKYHLDISLANVQKKILEDAFPEMNGLPSKEPANPFSKILRESADKDLIK